MAVLANRRGKAINANLIIVNWPRDSGTHAMHWAADENLELSTGVGKFASMFNLASVFPSGLSLIHI